MITQHRWRMLFSIIVAYWVLSYSIYGLSQVCQQKFDGCGYFALFPMLGCVAAPFSQAEWFKQNFLLAFPACLAWNTFVLVLIWFIGEFFIWLKKKGRV